MKKSSLAEMRKQYMEKPTAETTIEIDGIAYTVISHYVGSKDIGAVIRVLAEQQACEDLKNAQSGGFGRTGVKE